MAEAGCFTFVMWSIAFAIAIAALVTAKRALARSETLQQQIDFANQLIAELRRGATAQPVAEKSEQTAAAAPAEATAQPAAAPAPVEVVVPPPPMARPAPAPSEPPVAAAAFDVGEKITREEPVAVPIVAEPPIETPVVDTPVMAARETIEPPPAAFTAPPDLDAPSPIQTAPQRQQPLMSRIDWEGFVGVKLFSWVAGFLFLLAAIYFFKYTIEHGWVTPAIRMTIGLAVGATLLAVCELKFARNYRTTANALDGSGIAILYATLFAAHSLWHLIPVLAVFALMVLVTAVAVLLSLRRDSIFIAVLGLIGGFATPALLSTGENRPIGLFSYLLLLSAGLSLVSYRKRWAPLTMLSFAFTAFYQWAWVVKFLDQSQLPTAIIFFLLFPLVGVVVLAFNSRRDTTVPGPIRQTNVLGLVMPLVFALYIAGKPSLGASPHLFFGFLACIVVGIAVVAAAKIGNTFLHSASAMATVLIVAVWVVAHYNRDAWPGIVFWLAFLVAVYLAAPLVAQRFGRTYGDDGMHGALGGALLMFAFVLLPSREPLTANPLLLFAVLFVLGLIATTSTAHLVRWRVYVVTSLMLIAAAGAWADEFIEHHLQRGVSIYVALAIFLTAAPLILKRRTPQLRKTDAHGWLLAATVFLLFSMTNTNVATANVSLVELATMLLVIAAGAALVMAQSRTSVPLLVTAVVSWLVLVAWWAVADETLHRSGAITAVTLFALSIVAISLWRRAQGIKENDAGETLYELVGPLVGYLFLLTIAATPAMTNPPLTLLLAIVVLVVAIALLGRVLNRGGVHLFSVLLAELTLIVWTASSQRVFAATESILFELFFVGLVVALAEVQLFKRIGNAMTDRLFSGTAATALLFSLIGVVVAEGLSARPPFLLALIAVAALVSAILLQARFRELEVLSLLAVPPAAAAYFVWRDVPSHPLAPSFGEAMLFASLIYLLFALAPLVLVDRSAPRILPYATAALAGLPYFLFARTSMMDAGYGGVIGVLPLAQAALYGVLLLHLLRLEPAGARARGRLVLVAATALAFITVAIPLQLEKQWITVAWALEAAALAWLNRRVPHRALPIASTVLGAVVFARLALNPAVLTYHARSATPLINWYLYSYAVSAIALYLAASLLWRGGDRTKRVPLLNALATLLLFLLVNIEIADFYSTGATLTFNFSATLAQDLTYTIAWGAFAIAMLVAGILLHNRATRVAAIGLLVVTIFKCFLHDLGELGGLYRVGAFAGLALCLLAVAVLLQRFILTPRQAEGGVS